MQTDQECIVSQIDREVREEIRAVQEAITCSPAIAVSFATAVSRYAVHMIDPRFAASVKPSEFE